MYVDDFCVDENYKHQGIGTKLFDFLKDEADLIEDACGLLKIYCTVPFIKRSFYYEKRRYGSGIHSAG